MNIITEKRIVDNYLLNNFSIRKLSNKFNLSDYVIRKILINNSIKIRDNSSYKTLYSPLDESFFDLIDTEEKAYILGLLWADGCNIIKFNKIEISLQKKDREILQKVSHILFKKDYLKIRILENRYSNRQNQYRLTITNKHISKTLNEYGFNNQRNFHHGLPKCEIPKSVFHHFLRGLFDGDGSIFFINYSKDFAFKFIGSPMICDELKKKIKEYYNFDINLVKELSFSKPMARLNIHGNNKVKEFLNIVYNNATIFMKRKHLLFKKINSLKLKLKRFSEWEISILNMDASIGQRIKLINSDKRNGNFKRSNDVIYQKIYQLKKKKCQGISL